MGRRVNHTTWRRRSWLKMKLGRSAGSRSINISWFCLFSMVSRPGTILAILFFLRFIHKYSLRKDGDQENIFFRTLRKRDHEKRIYTLSLSSQHLSTCGGGRDRVCPWYCKVHKTRGYTLVHVGGVLQLYSSRPIPDAALPDPSRPILIDRFRSERDACGNATPLPLNASLVEKPLDSSSSHFSSQPP